MEKNFKENELKYILEKIDEAYDLIDNALNQDTWSELEYEASKGLEVLLKIKRKYQKEG